MLTRHPVNNFRQVSWLEPILHTIGVIQLRGQPPFCSPLCCGCKVFPFKLYGSVYYTVDKAPKTAANDAALTAFRQVIKLTLNDYRRFVCDMRRKQRLPFRDIVYAINVKERIIGYMIKLHIGHAITCGKQIHFMNSLFYQGLVQLIVPW